jgi:hypothetical protein
MKTKFLSLLAFIGLILILGTIPVFAGEASGDISTGVETGLGGVVKAAPTATPPAGIYTAFHSVSLTAPGSSTIYYTTNLTSEPSTSWNRYNSALTSIGTFNFKAAAYYADGTFGPVGQYIYTLSVPGGGGDPPALPTPPIPAPSPSPTNNEPENIIATITPVSASPTPLSPLTTVTPTMELTPALPTSPAPTVECTPLLTTSPTPSLVQTPDSTTSSAPTSPVELPVQRLNILLVAIVIAGLTALITIILVLKWHIKRS